MKRFALRLIPGLLLASLAIYPLYLVAGNWYLRSGDLERRLNRRPERLLIETGTALAASLDFEETLRRAARAAVPTLADFCTVDLIGANDTVQRVAAAALNDADVEKLANAVVTGQQKEIATMQGMLG